MICGEHNGKRIEATSLIGLAPNLFKILTLFNYLHLKEKSLERREMKEKQKERKRIESESNGY